MPGGGIDSISLFTLLGCLVPGGISVALNSKWNLYLSGVMDSAVFFPIVNGGMVLSALAAVLFFRERPAKLRRLGIASVIFLCDPFH